MMHKINTILLFRHLGCHSINTSWFTTFLITLFSHHWCLQDDLWSGSINMRWVHKLGLTPFKSWREYLMTDQYFSRTAMSCQVSLSVSLSLMKTGLLLLLLEEGVLQLGCSGFNSRRRCCSFSSSLSLRWPPGFVS